ncbi:hypothetical protein P154DRAFT_388610, partial [Amniculicola lignicola CBS 123094]
ATALEARHAAGLSEEQWRTFMIISRETAQVIVTAHPEWTWPHVPFPEKERARAEVNARLVEEGIPEVESDVFRWRMAQALGCIRQ